MSLKKPEQDNPIIFTLRAHLSSLIPRKLYVALLVPMLYIYSNIYWAPTVDKSTVRLGGVILRMAQEMCTS
jgi:hypothetical protein